MLDIKLFREEPETIKADLRKRGWSEEDISQVDEIIDLDVRWRESKIKADELKHERNKVSKEIPRIKKEGGDVSELIAGMKRINDDIDRLNKDIEGLYENRDSLRLRIPNIMDPTVPVGEDDSANVPITFWGERIEHDFEPQSHQDIIESLGLGDFDQSRVTSGSGFYYLFGDLVKLDFALMMLGIEHLTSNGFTVVEPPLMLTREAIGGAVDLSDFENVLYKIDGEDLYLIATSEHPLAGLHMGQILREQDLPLRYCGVSPCFRREIGAHGIDTKGIFRAHQFNKIEQFIFSTPEQSVEEHELMREMAEQLFQKLDLPYRMVNICTGDLGGTASKKYDLEVWMAKQGEYKEAVSCSNCTSYQARKLNTRVEYRDGNREIAHTLNSTAIATSRAIVAILENNQSADGTVEVPKALRQYMGGMETLSKRER